MLGGMDVRLLVVPGCPHDGPAMDLLARTLADLGHADVRVRRVVVRSQEQAEWLGFVGSPTVLVDGVDPFATTGQPPGLTCRIYRTAEGASAIPDPAALRRALHRAAGC